MDSILEVQLNEEILTSKGGCFVKVGNKVRVIKGADEYIDCTGKVDWVGDDQCVVIFDDNKPVKQNLLNCDQIEVIKNNELDETTLMEVEEDPIEGDGKVPIGDDNISVEVDGEVVTDPPVENAEEAQEDALDGYGPKLAITDMLLRAVNDENEAIQGYNDLIAACVEEGFEDISNVIKHIAEEENIHVGMLQHAMATISEQAKTIKDGEEEAAQIINGENDLTVDDTAIEA